MEPYYYNLSLSDGTSITIASPTALGHEELERIREEKEKNIKETGGAIKVTGSLIGQGVGGAIQGTSESVTGIRRAEAHIVPKPILKTVDLIATYGPTAVPVFLARKAGLMPSSADKEEILGWSRGVEEGVGGRGRALSEYSRGLAPDSDIAKYGGMLTETVGRLTPLIGTSLATGGLAAPVAIAGAQQFGGKAEQYEALEMERLRQQFPDADEADLLTIAAGKSFGPAFASGLKTAGITAFGGVLARSAGAWSETGLRGAAQKAADVANQNVWKKMGGGALIEGIEEAVDANIDVRIDRWKYNPELGHQSMAEQTAAGFLLGAIIGGGISGIGAKVEKGRAGREIKMTEEAEAAELMQMQEDLAAALAPRIEAKWLEKAGLSGIMPTGAFMRGGKRVIPEGARPDWLTEAHEAELLDISGKQALRKQVALGTLQQDIDEGYATYLLSPDSNLSESDKRILRAAGVEAEQEVADIESGRREALDPEDRAILDAAGVDTVEELYQQTVAEPEPAPTGGVIEPTGPVRTGREIEPAGIEGEKDVVFTEPELTQEQMLAQQAAMEAEAGVFAKKPLSPTPLRTTDQIFGVNVKGTRGRRDAAAEAAALAPEFTGPEAIAGIPPDVAVPSVPSKAADLGAILEGPEMRTTRAERRALKKEEKGIIRTAAEIKTIKDFRKKLEAWQKKREDQKKVRTPEGVEYRRSGITDEDAIDAGIAAGIAAAKAGESIGASLDAAVKAYKKASKEKVTINVSDLKDELAERISNEMGVSSGFIDGVMFHVAYTDSLPQIREGGLRPFQTSNWVEAGTGERYGGGQIFAMDNLWDAARWASEMDWNKNSDFGTGDISVVAFKTDKSWEIDESDPMSQAGNRGKWFKRLKPVSGEDILWAKPYDEAFQTEHRESLDERDRTMPAPTRKKLVKMRNAIRSWRRGRAGTSSLPVDVLTAQMIESALNVAIKALEVTGSVKKALDEAYASLDGTSVARGAFDAAMTQRMITALDEMEAGNTPEGAAAAAVSTDTSVMPYETEDQIRQMIEHEEKGIRLTARTFMDKVYDFPKLMWNLTIGRQEDTLESYGFKFLAERWNGMEHRSRELAGEFASMVFDREGGYNSAKNWMHIWTTIKDSEMKGVEAEVEDYFRARHKSQYENGPKPSEEALSPLAKNIVKGVGEAYEKMGIYAHNYGVYVVDAKGKVSLGEFKLGREGFPMGMKAEYRTVLDNLEFGSKMTPTVEFLIDRVGKSVKSVKDIRTLVEWRDGHKIKGYSDRVKHEERVSQMMSQLEKKRENPLDAELLDFSVDAFLGYINNWSRRMAEIEAFGQGIDPVMDKRDAFEVAMDIAHKKYGKPINSPEINTLKKARASAYRNARGWTGRTGEKVAAGLESFASFTMLTGVASAIRNMTGGLQNVAGAYYAGNTSAALRALGRLAGRGANSVSGKLLGRDLITLQDAAIDAAKLRSWGVLQQDMTHLMTGYEATSTEVSDKGRKMTAKEEFDKIRKGELSIIDVALRKIRRLQGVGLSITGFKGTEFTVRYDSALTAHVLVTDAIDAKNDKSNPQLLEEFRSFAGGMKGFDDAKINRLLKGDEQATVDFIVRFVTDTQGGYTPNQLPFWMTTPMGRFMSKFMPYGVMMNQLHAKNIRRRFRKSVKKAGGDPDNMSDAVTKAKFKDLKAYGMGSLLSLKDLLSMAALFGGGGEAFWQIMASLFGMNRDVPTWHEIASGDAPLPKRMWDLAGRWFENIQYTGTLGAVMEMGQQGMAFFGIESKRQKDLLEPAGIAVAKNVYNYMQDAQSQEEYLDAELMEKYFEKQFSLWRYGKRAAYRVSNAVELDWDRARQHKLQQDYYALRNAADRYADHKGMDTDSMFSGGGRFLPSPYKRFYTDIHDELYLGNTIGAREAALKVASLMGDDRDKSWSRVSNSVVSSQPLKVGGYTNTDIQNDFLKWAKRNLSYDDYASIVNLQQTYEGTAKAAGLISGGNPRVARDMKLRMNLKAPKGRKKKPPDRIEEILKGY